MIYGIDISHWQGKPDFTKVKAAGIQYAMIKATEGINYVDPCFTANIKAAIAAGIPVGVYHLLRSGSVADQATDFIAAIKPYPITWPAALDVESGELTALGKDKLTGMILDFCARVKAAGYKPMVYSNRNWFYIANLVDIDRIRAAGISIWLAWYNNATPTDTDRSGMCDMWQYASNGKVSGITGNVDLNVSYKDFGALPFTCDTSGTVDINVGGCYTAKTTGPINLIAGKSATSARVQIIRCVWPDFILWHIVPIEFPGQTVGIYAEGGKKMFTVRIK